MPIILSRAACLCLYFLSQFIKGSVITIINPRELDRLSRSTKQDSPHAQPVKVDSTGWNVEPTRWPYTGEVTLFGKKYDANYAPLTDESGRLTGAVMVSIKK